MAASRYFESRDEGVKLSKEELEKIKEEYKESFDSSEYTNKEFSYKYEKTDGAYNVYFTLYEGEEYRFEFSYDMEQQYISFGDKEFRVE